MENNKVEHIKPIPLVNLSHNSHSHPHITHVNNNLKDATPEKVNELRNALASVLGKKSEKREEIEKPNIDIQKKENIQNTHNRQNMQRIEDKDNSIKEVSSEILKNVLKVD